MDKHSVLSIEKLAAFMDGNLTQDEMSQISQMADDNYELHQMLDANDVIDNTIASFDAQDLKLPDEIIGADFRIPDIENVDFFSSGGDSIAEKVNLYGKEDNNIDDILDHEIEPIYSIHNMNTFKQTIGDLEPFPDALPNNVQQLYDDTCAIKSQQIVLKSFGQDIPEEILRQEAINLGIYSPGHGTLPDDAGELLNSHNVPTHVVHNAHVYDLVSELAQGHKVIVGVDSGELWHPSVAEKMEDIFGEHADHALVVTGIDTTDPDNVEVIITDPGSGDVAIRYPMAQFIDAWHDSHCIMIATDIPAPSQFDPNMVNFDYDAGHIAFINDVSYGFFSETMLPEINQYFNANHLFSGAGNADSIFDHAFDAFSSYDASSGINFVELL